MKSIIFSTHYNYFHSHRIISWEVMKCSPTINKLTHPAGFCTAFTLCWAMTNIWGATRSCDPFCSLSCPHTHTGRTQPMGLCLSTANKPKKKLTLVYPFSLTYILHHSWTFSVLLVFTLRVVCLFHWLVRSCSGCGQLIVSLTHTGPSNHRWLEVVYVWECVSEETHTLTENVFFNVNILTLHKNKNTYP